MRMRGSQSATAERKREKEGEWVRDIEKEPPGHGPANRKQRFTEEKQQLCFICIDPGCNLWVVVIIMGII